MLPNYLLQKAEFWADFPLLASDVRACEVVGANEKKDSSLRSE